MGDVSEMMLDGTLCERCGVFIGEPVGHPRYCEDCSSAPKSGHGAKKRAQKRRGASKGANGCGARNNP